MEWEGQDEGEDVLGGAGYGAGAVCIGFDVGALAKSGEGGRGG